MLYCVCPPWEALAEEATAEIEALKDTIKKEMDGRGVEVIEAGQYIARFTTVHYSITDMYISSNGHNRQRYVRILVNCVYVHILCDVV